MSIIIPANTLAGGYDVENSLRFEKGSSDFLNRTFGTSTGEGTWTYSVWLKISDPSFIDNHVFFSGGGASDNRTQLYFGETTGTLNIYRSISGSTVNLESDASFRDPSAWYNLCVQNNAGTVAAYMNGVAVTLDGSSLGTNVINKSDTVHKIGRGATGTYTSSYMSEIVFIDGTVVAPTGFGEFDEDSNIWKPIDVSGLTFGDNGFYLEFKQVGTSQNSSGLGADTSGNDNHFAVNNLTAVDESTDTCTNNFCTMNPLAVYFNATESTYTEGNLQVATASASNSDNPSSATFGMTKGKWYWEVKFVSEATGGDDVDWSFIGMMAQNPTAATGDVFLGGPENQFAYRGYQGKVFRNNTVLATLAAYTSGDIISIAYNADDNLIFFYKNGAIQNSGTGLAVATPASTPLGAWFPAVSVWDTRTFIWQMNFGSPPYAVSSSNADANGFGDFEYAVPSGFFALCTKNLAEHG